MTKWLYCGIFERVKIMYKYRAVTTTTPINSTELLRLNKQGMIEQYNAEQQRWQEASGEMYGIYTGIIECEAISEKEANEIIEVWNANVAKGVKGSKRSS